MPASSTGRDWSTPEPRPSRCIRARHVRCTPARPTTSLTAELVELVDIPVNRLRRRDLAGESAHRAETTGAAAVMVGRGAQGNPWSLREILTVPRPSPAARRSRPSSSSSRVRPCERWASAVPRLFEEVLRLVSRSRPLSAPVQAGAGAPRIGRRGRRAAARRRHPGPQRCSSGSRWSSRPSTTRCSSCRSRSTAGG